MADLYPQPYTTTSPVLANYSYTDIANGTGVITLYPCMADDTISTEELFLTEKITTPHKQTKVISGNTTTEADVDYNFDLTPFNITKTAAGTAIITFSHKRTSGGTTWHVSSRLMIAVKIIKWDGTTETLLGSKMLYDYPSSTIDTDMHNATMLIPLDLTTFAVGDILRLQFTANATGDNGYSPGITIGIDPTAVDTGSFTSPYTTQTKLNIPFRLDL